MHQLDSAAGERLQEVVEQLRAAHVIDVLERTVSLVWRANTARYEPSDLGDTPRSLGVTAAENIRERTLRERWSPTGKGDFGQDVHVTAPNDSLLVESGGVSLRRDESPANGHTRGAELGRLRLGQRKRRAQSRGSKQSRTIQPISCRQRHPFRWRLCRGGRPARVVRCRVGMGRWFFEPVYRRMGRLTHS